jgi:hypothetical protein
MAVVYTMPLPILTLALTLYTFVHCVHAYTALQQTAIVLAMPRPPESYTDLACMQVHIVLLYIVLHLLLLSSVACAIILHATSTDVA